MKVFVAALVVLAALPTLGACRRYRDGNTANDPLTPPAYDGGTQTAEPGQATQPGLPEGHPRLGPPAPTVTAQPGDVQL